MYFDYYLKFPDEKTCLDTLFDIIDSDYIPKYDAIDIIGIINISTGKMITIDDQDIPEMIPVEGFHVNVRHSTEITELHKWIVTPRTPQRVWF